MKILLFGGSFSPPTLAHEAIIADCLGLSEFSEVWLVPSADRADKLMSASWSHRIAMLHIVAESVFKNNSRLKICGIENTLPKPAQLYATHKALEQKYPGIEFWFAFGNDAYRDMPEWAHGRQLQRKLNVIVFGDKAPNAAVHFIKLPAKFSNISSTQARTNKNPRASLSKPIADYLQAKALYPNNTIT